MIYERYVIGGELMHSSKGTEWGKHKYVEKVKNPKTGKWRYIYGNNKGYTYYSKGKARYNFKKGEKLGLINDDADKSAHKYAKKKESKANEELGKKLGLIPNEKNKDIKDLVSELIMDEYKKENIQELGPKFKEIDEILDKKVDSNISLDDYDKLLSETVNKKYGTNYSGAGIRNIINRYDRYEEDYEKYKKKK